MGYWNGYRDFNDWAEFNGYTIQCQHCSKEITPNSGNQKYCSDREENPACIDDRYFQKLWDKGEHPLQLTKQ